MSDQPDPVISPRRKPGPKARVAPVAALPEVSALAEQVAALTAQNDKMLDLLVEQRDELDQLKASGGTVAANIATEEEAQLNAELEGLLAEFKDYPQIQVFEQRVLVGADASMEIRLQGDAPISVDPTGASCRWKLRWFNLGKEGRAQQAVNEGYEKVRWSDLQDQEMVAIGVRTDEYVRKGDRGQEVLMRMPLKLYIYKKKRDAANLHGLLTSESKLREHLAGNVAAMAGHTGGNASQAGDFIHGRGFTTTITPGPRETVTL